MPTPNTQQPQPGPSPTPTPKPAAAIEIGEILAMTEGAVIVPASGWLPSFFVTQEYLDTCEPAPGGFFVEFADRVSFMSATSYEERYG